MRKNILFFILVLVLSLATAPYFGNLYNYFVPQYDNSLLGLSNENVIFVAGVPFSYMFLVPFVFGLFGSKNKWALWLLAPVFLFFAYSDIRHIYLPIILTLVGFALAFVIRKMIEKLHHPNHPMIIK